ncbi:MAG: alpha/beta hydrolase, partial [Microthrixaceae bacterium]|nr:alpha/beta hydrolase [Microthrixaceae bacterium]
GGLATVRLAERGDSRFAGLILTGPALATAESIPAPLVAMANILGRITPWLPTIALDGNAVSRDEAVRADYDSDPLNFRGKLSARTGREINIAMNQAMAQAHSITVPVLVLHGDADTLASPQGSREFVKAVGSTDVTHREWPGAYHELHHEPEREEVLQVITDWINEHLSNA